MTVAVVGAGHAGVQLAASLRDEGYQDPIVLFDEQDEIPYQRPPLSKQFLGDDVPGQPLRAPHFYASHGIDLRLGARATQLRLDEQTVRLQDGSSERYTHLVLALGSSNRDLAIPGSELDGVVELRTIAEARTLQHRLHAAMNVVVIGGGFIGMEVAAIAAGSATVTVVEPQDRVLARSVTPMVSDAIQRAHRRAGVVLRQGESVTRLTGHDGRVHMVTLSDGSELTADLVLVAVGVRANTDLAAAAGLRIDGGVLVDPWLRTSAPGVFAIGDCVSRSEEGLSVPRRIESVQNAVDQARHVASSIAHGIGEPYGQVPWFWTHQFTLRVQMAGIGHWNDDLVVLGDPEQDSFSVGRFQEGRLVAVESVNRPADHLAARRLLALRWPLSIDAATDDGFDLKSYARARV